MDVFDNLKRFGSQFDRSLLFLEMRRMRKGIWKSGRHLHGHSTSFTELFAWCKAQTALWAIQQH